MADVPPPPPISVSPPSPVPPPSTPPPSTDNDDLLCNLPPPSTPPPQNDSLLVPTRQPNMPKSFASQRRDSIGPPPISPRMKSELIREANERRERRDSIGPPPLSPRCRLDLIQQSDDRRERCDSIGPPPLSPMMKDELLREANVRRERADSIGPPPDPLMTKSVPPKFSSSPGLTVATKHSTGLSQSMSCLRRTSPHNLPPPSLATVLVNEGLLTDFRKFLEEEFATENLEFIEACDAFADTKMPPELIAKEARRIYDQYVREGAPNEVNISGPMRKTIQKGVFQQGVVYQGIFEDAARELSRLLEANFMLRWLQKNTWKEIDYVPNQQNLPTLKQVLEHYRLRNQFEWFLVAEGQQNFLYLWEALTRLVKYPTIESAQSILSLFPEQLKAIPEGLNILTAAVSTKNIEPLKTVDPTPIFRMLQTKYYSRWVVLQTWSLVKLTVNPSSFIPAALQQEESPTVILQQQPSFKHIHADDETSALAAIAAANALAAASGGTSPTTAGPDSVHSPKQLRDSFPRFSGLGLLRKKQPKP